MANLARVVDDEEEMESLPAEPTGDETPTETPETDWLAVSNEAFDASDRYVKASLATEWERNLRMWQSRHPSGSKYLSDAYQGRSKIFRPKTRSAMRKREAAAANAFFATHDVVIVEADDDSNDLQRAGAAVSKELLNYRLQKTLPWFLIAIGAYQDSNIFGFCCSRQGWIYEEKENGPPTLSAVFDELGQPQTDPVTGMAMMTSTPDIKVLTDRPDITLIPPENVRIDYGASWIDQAQSSPFLIVMHAMYVCDIEARMKAIDPKTKQPRWKTYDADVIRAARNEMHDTVRKARYQNRQDPVDSSSEQSLSKFDIVYVRECFLRVDGEDMTYWTLGSQKLLTDPAPTNEVYWYLNRRPYRIGVSMIEAHQAIPTGVVAMGSELQNLANTIVNDRNDNVRLALQARYFVRAGGNVDMESLKRNTPGASTVMQNVETDVRVERAPDVTRSAYEEQDRTNNDYDELIGHFSSSSVQSQRSLNETVGGMQMLNNAVNSVQDFDLRVWSETFVEPVLRDLLKMEQALEDDHVVLAIAGKRAQLFQQFKMEFVTDELLSQDFNLSVNVGFGATDPMQRLQKFQVAGTTVGQFLGPQVQQQLDAGEIIDEVFGILGYKDGRRFFKLEEGQDPQVAMMQQEIQRLQDELKHKMAQAHMDYDARMKEIAADASKTAAEIRAEMQIENEKIRASTVTESNKMLIEIAKLMQDSKQAHAENTIKTRDQALGVREQNFAADQDRATRITESARAAAKQKSDDDKAAKKANADDEKAAKKAKDDEDKRANSDAILKSVADAVVKMSEAMSRPRTIKRGPDGKAIGLE